MVIEGFAFDLEGTVVDVEAAHHQGHLAVAKEVGINLILRQALTKIPHFIGGPDDSIVGEIWELSDRSLTPKQILQKDKDYYFFFLRTLKIKPRPGFIEFYTAVAQLGLPMAIGSLTETAQAQTLLDYSGLSKFFDQTKIVLREHVQNLKPAPDVFLQTAKALGISPGNQLVFEDSPNGVKAALAAGSVAIGMPVYRRRETVLALKNAGACCIFKSWKEIELPELLTAFADI